MTITKFTKTFLYLAYALAIVFTVMFFMGLDGTENRSEQNIAAAGPYLTYSYVLAIIAIVLVIGFSVVNIFVNPSNIKKTLFGLVALVIIGGVSYALSSDAPLNFTSKDVAELYNKDTVTLVWSDTGLIASYFLFVIAVLGLLFTELRDFFKR